MRTPDFSRSFGERLASERDRLGFTQEAFAAAAGISHRSVTGYEANRFMVPDETLLRFAEIGVNVPYLMLGVYPIFDRQIFERVRRVIEQGSNDDRGRPLHQAEMVLRMVSAYCWLLEASSADDAAERLWKVRADAKGRPRDQVSKQAS
jgi:transcriptional regulator with XRE-family HTH domain